MNASMRGCCQSVGTSRPARLVQMHRLDMNDARGDEDEKQWHVQDVPNGEQSLIHAEFRNLAGRAQTSRDVVERNTLESFFLSRDSFVSGRRGLNRGTCVAVQKTLTRCMTYGDDERRRDHAQAAPVCCFQEA